MKETDVKTVVGRVGVPTRDRVPAPLHYGLCGSLKYYTEDFAERYANRPCRNYADSLILPYFVQCPATTIHSKTHQHEYRRRSQHDRALIC
jgi:hypothetical protein